MSKKFICPVCGYVYEGEEMPEKCPICGKQMQEVKEDIKTWAAEHIVGVAKDAPEDIKASCSFTAMRPGSWSVSF